MAKGKNKPITKIVTAKSGGKASGKSSGKASASTPARKQSVEVKVVSDNRRARFEYEIIDSLECGMMLVGSEVKSLRNGKVSLEEAYARVQNGEVWLVGADIPEYPQATIWNHAPRRPRKLLVRKSEVSKFADRAHEKGLTLVPLKIFFTDRGLAKLVLGLCRGKQLHDKRESIKKADAKRDIARAMRRK